MFVLRIISLGVFISLYRGVDGIADATANTMNPYFLKNSFDSISECYASFYFFVRYF